ncbi:MAG: hypothetical protein ACXW1R_05430 [Halobacteriota archaeon]
MLEILSWIAGIAGSGLAFYIFFIEKIRKNRRAGEGIFAVKDGVRFNNGYLSDYFINNGENMCVEMQNPLILFTDKTISRDTDILPSIEIATKTSRPLLIIADDIKGEALTSLVVSNMRGIAKLAAVKAPNHNGKVCLLEDLAILTGGTLISKEIGLNLKDIDLASMGRCKAVQVTKENTTIFGGQGSKEKIMSRITQIRLQSSDALSRSRYRALRSVVNAS